MSKDRATRGERRRHERFPCDGNAEVVASSPELLFRGEVRDVSLTGCYIATRARLKLQRYAQIELRFSANGLQVSAPARVMDVRPGSGVGVEFLHGDPRMRERLRELIEHLKAQGGGRAEHGSGGRPQQEVSARKSEQDIG